MRTTAELRTIWGPACAEHRLVRVPLHSGARLAVRDTAAEAFRAVDAVMQAFGYAPRPGDTGAYNCRKITNGTGFSLHAYGIAADYNWNSNPYRSDNVTVTDMPAAMTGAIEAIRTSRGDVVFRWGGNFERIKDTMHFEVNASPEELGAGIDWSTVRQPECDEARPSTWPLLRRGSAGQAVAELKRRLAIAGFTVVVADELLDEATEDQVLAFQRSRRLNADGIVGLQTWTALLTGQPTVDMDDSPVKLISADVSGGLTASARAATSLNAYYRAFNRGLPPVANRAAIWAALGLGRVGDYHGTSPQNTELLEVLKRMAACPRSAAELG